MRQIPDDTGLSPTPGCRLPFTLVIYDGKHVTAVRERLLRSLGRDGGVAGTGGTPRQHSGRCLKDALVSFLGVLAACGVQRPNQASLQASRAPAKLIYGSGIKTESREKMETCHSSPPCHSLLTFSLSVPFPFLCTVLNNANFHLFKLLLSILHSSLFISFTSSIVPFLWTFLSPSFSLSFSLFIYKFHSTCSYPSFLMPPSFCPP